MLLSADGLIQRTLLHLAQRAMNVCVICNLREIPSQVFKIWRIEDQWEQSCSNTVDFTGLIKVLGGVYSDVTKLSTASSPSSWEGEEAAESQTC